MNFEQSSRTQIRAVTVGDEIRGQLLLRVGLDQHINSLPFGDCGAGSPSVEEALWAEYLAGRKGGRG